MARPREFDEDQALDSAIGVFREHGFEGTSAGMQVDAMKKGRQTLYDTFGDKWQLYCSSLRRYSSSETAAHLAELCGGPRAIDGIRAMIDRLIAEAHTPCLGVSSVCEFGRTRKELTAIRAGAGRTLYSAIAARIREAQAEGDVAADVDPDEAATFLTANFAGIRLAARDGAGPNQLRALGRLALRALGQ